MNATQQVARDAARDAARGGLWRYPPAGAYVETMRVRSYEVGRDGRMSLGTVLRYLESLATDDSAARGYDFRWYEERGSAWFVREMDVTLGVSPMIGEAVTLATWVGEFRRVQAQREYAIWLTGSGRLVARASGRWAYVDRTRGTPLRIAEEITQGLKTLGGVMQPRRHVAMGANDAAGDVARSTLLLTARGYEADVLRHVNNCVYADWLSEGVALALADGGTPGAEDARARLRYAHIEYLRSALPGDAMVVETRLGARGSRGMASEQVIRGAGAEGVVYARAWGMYLRGQA